MPPPPLFDTVQAQRTRFDTLLPCIITQLQKDNTTSLTLKHTLSSQTVCFIYENDFKRVVLSENR